MQILGITINSDSTTNVTRMLPTAGEVLVQQGQQVEALDVVARAEIPSRYRIIDVARQLGQSTVGMSQLLLKEEGDSVAANEAIAMIKGRFLRRVARTPADGYIAAIGAGWVLLETERTITEIQAFVNGRVSRIIPNRGVIVEARGAMIEAVCGFGGEAYGRLKRLVTSPFEPLEEAALDESLEQTILLGGSSIDEAGLRKAEEMQVRGIIVGSIDASLMNLEPPVVVRVVATEGFGNLPMSPHTFGILTALDGQDVSIRGQTPTITAPNSAGSEADPPLILATSHRSPSSQPTKAAQRHEIEIGSQVRVARGKLLGMVGLISSIPPKPLATEAGIIAPGAYVAINDTPYYIPWSNLQQIN